VFVFFFVCSKNRYDFVCQSSLECHPQTGEHKDIRILPKMCLMCSAIRILSLFIYLFIYYHEVALRPRICPT